MYLEGSKTEGIKSEGDIVGVQVRAGKDDQNILYAMQDINLENFTRIYLYFNQLFKGRHTKSRFTYSMNFTCKYSKVDSLSFRKTCLILNILNNVTHLYYYRPY